MKTLKTVVSVIGDSTDLRVELDGIGGKGYGETDNAKHIYGYEYDKDGDPKHLIIFNPIESAKDIEKVLPQTALTIITPSGKEAKLSDYIVELAEEIKTLAGDQYIEY